MATFGSIKNPADQFGDTPQGFFDFLSIILKLAGTVAGIYFVIQIIMAGFGYINAGGDEKKISHAWAVIWQSMIGMVIVSSAFIIASIIGRITGTNPLTPTLYGPN